METHERLSQSKKSVCFQQTSKPNDEQFEQEFFQNYLISRGSTSKSPINMAPQQQIFSKGWKEREQSTIQQTRTNHFLDKQEPKTQRKSILKKVIFNLISFSHHTKYKMKIKSKNMPKKHFIHQYLLLVKKNKWNIIQAQKDMSKSQQKSEVIEQADKNKKNQKSAKSLKNAQIEREKDAKQKNQADLVKQIEIVNNNNVEINLNDSNKQENTKPKEDNQQKLKQKNKKKTEKKQKEKKTCGCYLF